MDPVTKAYYDATTKEPFGENGVTLEELCAALALVPPENIS